MIARMINVNKSAGQVWFENTENNRRFYVTFDATTKINLTSKSFFKSYIGQCYQYDGTEITNLCRSTNNIISFRQPARRMPYTEEAKKVG